MGAQAASLTFMLGASSRSGDLVKRVKPVLAMMGAKVLHLGGQGAGLSGKLANNYLLAVSNIATAEAMNLGLRWGLDPTMLGELINGSSGRCWSSEVNNPVPGVSPGAPADHDYEGGFGVELMKKDLKLAIEEARRVGAKVEMGERAGDVYDDVEVSEPGRDFSVVYRWLRSVLPHKNHFLNAFPTRYTAGCGKDKHRGMIEMHRNIVIHTDLEIDPSPSEMGFHWTMFNGERSQKPEYSSWQHERNDGPAHGISIISNKILRMY